MRGTAEAFCLLVTPCHHRDDLALDHGGPATTAWLAIAQCFAGPPAECCFSNLYLYRAVHDYHLLRDAALPRIVGRSDDGEGHVLPRFDVAGGHVHAIAAQSPRHARCRRRATSQLTQDPRAAAPLGCVHAVAGVAGTAGTAGNDPTGW